MLLNESVSSNWRFVVKGHLTKKIYIETQEQHKNAAMKCLL